MRAAPHVQRRARLNLREGRHPAGAGPDMSPGRICRTSALYV